MSDRLPPLTALRAFDAAARHMSFAKAADELNAFYDTIQNAQCEDGVLSVANISEVIEVQLMPNPASSYVDIVLDIPGNIDASILDMSGKVLEMEEGKGMVTFDISGLSNGTYFVRIESGASIVTKKLIADH